VSKRQHQKQVERARAKRRTDRFERRRRRARYTAIAAVVALGLSIFAVALLNVIDREPDPAELGADEPEGACPPPDDAPEVDAEQYDEPPPLEIDEDASYLATIDTTCGRIEVELDPAGAPMATNNFVFLAREGFYDGVIFHRVIEDFMIQGGDPEGTGTGGPGYTFEDELGPAEQAYEEVRSELLEQLEEEGQLEPDGDVDPDTVPGGYPRGVLAMANSGPDTNGSQFFITRNDPAILPGPDYTLFGEVVEGMDVVDLIATEPTDPQDRPLEPVRIISIEISEA
jgi:cyclophilin family peptidyl-prolyl cis-trans isomerase